MEGCPAVFLLRRQTTAPRGAKIADPSTHRGSAESQVRSVYQRSSTGTHSDGGKGCPPPVKANPRFRTASPSRVRFAAPKTGAPLMAVGRPERKPAVKRERLKLARLRPTAQRPRPLDRDAEVHCIAGLRACETKRAQFDRAAFSC